MSRIKLLQWYLTATVPIAVIFFIIPFEIFYPQRVLWENSTKLPLFYVVIGSSFFIFGCPIFYLIARKWERCLQTFSIILFILGLFILLADIFSPLQSTPMDGWIPHSAEPRFNTYIEGVIFIILALLVIFLRRDLLSSIVINMAIVVWATALSYFILVVCQGNQNENLRRSVEYNRELPNIYHIVLDELQSDAALIGLRDLKLLKKLSGFTLFPFNSSSYLFTSSSFPNYMSGETYKNDQPFNEWLKIYQKRGILKFLSEKGYSISMQVPAKDWENLFVNEYQTLDQIMHKNIDSPLPGLSDFMPIWLARILPNKLSDEALSFGSAIEAKTFRLFGYSGRYPRALNDGREPFASVIMLQEAIKNESDLSPFGRYTYMHAVLPHGPYVINGECQFTRQLNPNGVISYYKQTICSLKLISNFIEELKRLNRYDNSILIIHADTGHGLRGLIEQEGNSVTRSSFPYKRAPNPGMKRYPDWSPDELYARTLSFLMIKPIGSKEQARFSKLHSKLIDIYPTLVNFFEKPIGNTSFEGRDLSSINSFELKRENTFYLYDPRRYVPEIKQFSWDESRAEAHLNSLILKMQSKNN